LKALLSSVGRSFADLRPSDLPGEVAAGLSVAAVAIPIALAYSKILGVPSEIGLYATIAGGLAYALFGPSSRYLIVGPDTATCLVFAAAISTLGYQAPADRAAIGAGITLLAGVAFLCAAVLRLGFIASLISKPVLVGYLTGVSLTLAISQLSSITHVTLSQPGLFRPLIELARRGSEVHWPSVFAGVGTLAALRILKRVTPHVPGPAVAVVAAIALSWALDLRSRGFSTIGEIPAGLPPLRLPLIAGDPVQLALATLGVLIVGFSSGILTARAFGENLGISNNANRELAGFGAANIAAGLFHGFAVTGADSRTAVALSAGGKSALVGIIAAGVVALVATVLASPLSFLPEAVLGAILLSAATDLFDAKALARLARIDRSELIFALVATAGVIWIGVLQGIFLAVLLTFVHLLRMAARPVWLLVGRDPDSGHLVTLHRCENAIQSNQITIFLFEGSLFFLNAEWFRKSVEEALSSRPDSRWLVLDASPMMYADSGAVDALTGLNATLNGQGINLLIGGGHGRFREVLVRSGFVETIGADRIFETPELALAAAEAMRDEG
jgi:SulP family sulfate permease